VYKHHGYFRPEELHDLSQKALAAPVGAAAGHLLRAFVATHAQPA
jgi:hypothetical protein